MAGHKKRKSLRLASYNIRKARGLDMRRDPYRVLEVINRLEADIVVLQEADHRLGERPAALPRRAVEAETDFDVLSANGSDCSLGWHGNAVLVRKGTSAAQPEQVALPGLEPRGALSFEAEHFGGVTIVGTHLGLMRRHRQKQLSTIAKRLQKTETAIIIGDFNEWSASQGFDPIRPRFSVVSPGRSFHAARPLAALDRIAHTRGLEITDAGVDESPLARVASDHLPIWADIRLTAA